MSPQTNYDVNQPAGRPGLLYDDVNVNSVAKRSDEAVPFGRFVSHDGEDDLVRLPEAAEDVTTKGLAQGVAISVYSDQNTQEGIGSHPIGNLFDVVRRARVHVRTEVAVVPSDPVYVRFAGSPHSGEKQITVWENETNPGDLAQLTTGHCKFSFKGVKSAFVDFDASFGVIQAALEAVSTIGVGNIVVTGTLNALDLAVAFIGDLEAEDQPLMLITDSTLKVINMQQDIVEVLNNNPGTKTVTINGTPCIYESVGTPAVAQVNTETILNNTPAPFTVTINGTPFTFEPTVETIEQIRDALISAINGGAEPVTATPDSTNKIVVTADVAGTAFTCTATANITNTPTTPNAAFIPELIADILDGLVDAVNDEELGVTAQPPDAANFVLVDDVPGTGFTTTVGAGLDVTNEAQPNVNDTYSALFEESGDYVASPELLGECRGLFRNDEDDQGGEIGVTAALLTGARFMTAAPAGGVAVLDLDI